MKLIAKVVLGLLFAVSVRGFSRAQSPLTPQHLGFKANHLGMTLAEFKATNAQDTVWVEWGPPKLFGRPKKRVRTPLCSDTMRDFPGDNRMLEPGEEVCNASPGIANPEGKMMGGQLAQSVIYRFFDGRLCEISATIPAINYSVVASALKDKYGEPTSRDTETFQNGYGASWKGDFLRWEWGSETVAISEGPGNGPAQDPMKHFTIVSIKDSALMPKPAPQHEVDF